MRIPRTLAFYIGREMALYALLGFFGFTAVLVSQNLLRMLRQLAGAGIPLSDVMVVLGHLLPIWATYALPFAFLLGVLVAVGRLSADSEVTAMRACGVGLFQLMTPALVLGLLASATTAWLMIEVEPSLRRNLNTVARDVASRTRLVKPGRVRGFGDRMLFVREMDPDDNVRGVMIWDFSDEDRPFSVFAERGRVSFDADSAILNFQLERGDVHLEPDEPRDPRYQRISFETFDYAFDIGALLAGEAARLRPRHMSMAELRRALERIAEGDELRDLKVRDPAEYHLQIHRRLALPAAPLMFALVGVPLGLRRARGARSWGALVCAALAFVYYGLLGFAEYLVLGDLRLPPAAALWIPNALFLLAAVPLILRARRGHL